MYTFLIVTVRLLDTHTDTHCGIVYLVWVTSAREPPAWHHNKSFYLPKFPCNTRIVFSQFSIARRRQYDRLSTQLLTFNGSVTSSDSPTKNPNLLVYIPTSINTNCNSWYTVDYTILSHDWIVVMYLDILSCLPCYVYSCCVQHYKSCSIFGESVNRWIW